MIKLISGPSLLNGTTRIWYQLVPDGLVHCNNGPRLLSWAPSGGDVGVGAIGGTAVKVTVAVWASMMLSVVSVAVKVERPGVLELTVKVATPDELVVPEAGLMVSTLPRLEVKLTFLPATALPLKSFRVTVIVAVLLPFAGTEVGEAVTVEFAGLTGPGGVKVTIAV